MKKKSSYCPTCWSIIDEKIEEFKPLYKCAKIVHSTLKAPAISLKVENDPLFQPEIINPIQDRNKTQRCGTERNDKRAKCSRCYSSKPVVMICKQCKNTIPRGWLQGRGLTIALIGAASAGKTNFIVSLHEWWKRNLASFGLCFEARMDNKLTTEFYKMRDSCHKIDNERDALKATPLDDDYAFMWEISQINNLYSHLIFGEKLAYTCRSIRKSIPGKYCFGFTRFLGNPPIHFVFHDAAGENLENIDLISERSGYVGNADHLIYLIDLAQFPIVSQDHASHQACWSDGTPKVYDPMTSLNSVISLLREQRGQETGKLKIPLAICLNKIDIASKSVALEEFKSDFEFKPDYLDQERASHEPPGVYDRERMDELSRRMMIFATEKLGLSSLLALAHKNFSDVRVFPTATRATDEENGYYSFGVEYPFLWIMSHEKMIEDK